MGAADSQATMLRILAPSPRGIAPGDTGIIRAELRGAVVTEPTSHEYSYDTGFTADGDFIDGILHHAGMILYRDGLKPADA